MKDDGLEVGNHRTRQTETSPLVAPSIRLGDIDVRPGALVQVTGRLPLSHSTNANVFDIQRARLSLRATLGKAIEGFVRANLTDEPSLLDARITYRVSSDVEVAAGRFKTPFSYEYLTSSAGTDFIDRSRVVRALVPNRRVGIQAGVSPGDVVEVAVGAFNGRAPEAEVADDRDRNLRLLGVARFAVHLPTVFFLGSGVRATFGANVASERGAAHADSVLSGPTTVAGVDGRLRLGRVVLAAEWIGASTRHVPTGPFNRSGSYVTAAYDVAFNHRLLARMDRYDGSNDLVFGYNSSVHAGAAAQINVVIPLDDRAKARPAALVAGVQVSF